MKVIYISFVRLTDRIARDWYINYLIENGISVQFWDIIPLVREEHMDFGMIDPGYLIKIHNYKELEEKLLIHQNSDTLYVMLISYSARFSKIFRLLSKYNCRMLFISQGAMPVIVKPRSWKVINHINNPIRLLRIIVDNVKAKAFRKLKLVKPFDAIFYVGAVMKHNDQYTKKMIPINLCDYDLFRKSIPDGNRLVDKRYAVFLDINAAYHADFAICGLPMLDPDNYFRSLNQFFKLLETDKNIKVVIASHPTSNYNNVTFHGREVFRLNTAKLVKDAEFVITHHSTSLSYAVLNLKSVVFCYTNEMLFVYKETIVRQIRAQAEYLDSKTYNVDDIQDGKQVIMKDINEQCYKNYKYDFLTSPQSEYSRSEKIFLDAIRAEV